MYETNIPYEPLTGEPAIPEAVQQMMAVTSYTPMPEVYMMPNRFGNPKFPKKQPKPKKPTGKSKVPKVVRKVAHIAVQNVAKKVSGG